MCTVFVWVSVVVDLAVVAVSLHVFAVIAVAIVLLAVVVAVGDGCVETFVLCSCVPF